MKKEGLATNCHRYYALRIAQLGLLFALAVCLSFVESLIPSLPIPGIKLGLSNIVVMYAVFVLGGWHAVLLVVLKALFALLSRGAVAGLLAFCGGSLSVVAMLALLLVFGHRISDAAVSMAGAIAHNLGQLACAAALLQLGQVLWYYLPVLVAAGVASGLLTALLLRAVMPLLRWSQSSYKRPISK